MVGTVLAEESPASYSAQSCTWEGSEHCLELCGVPLVPPTVGIFFGKVQLWCLRVSGCGCVPVGDSWCRSVKIPQELWGLPLMRDKGPRCGLHCDSWAI